MEKAKTLEQGEVEPRKVQSGQGSKPHPLFIAAAVAVLLFCVLGAAALTGILPTATSRTGDQAAQQTPAPPASQPVAAAPAAKPKAASPATKPQAAAPCASCGVIETINAVEVKGKTSGIGAVAGGVAGGVLGNAVGGGHGVGNAVLTVGGAAGGAFAGDAIEGHVKKHTVWRVTVRLDDGSVRSLQQSARPPFAVGERVRIVDGKGIERA
jgi:outer membrane lipoprotein SlyB